MIDPPGILDWRERATALDWDPDDLVAVTAALVPTRNPVRVYHWAKSKQTEKGQPGPYDERHIPPYVTVVADDIISVCDAYGHECHYGVTMPRWARIAERYGWVSPVPGTLDPELTMVMQFHYHWEPVTVTEHGITFTSPDGSTRTFHRGELVPTARVASVVASDTATVGSNASSESPRMSRSEQIAHWNSMWKQIARWRATGEPAPEPPQPVERQTVRHETRTPDLPIQPHRPPVPAPSHVPASVAAPPEPLEWREDAAWDGDAPMDDADSTVDDQPTDTTDDPLRPGTIVAYTDGSGTGSADESGHAGIGVAVFRDGIALCEASEYIGPGTSNVAEVRALGRALAIVYALTDKRRDVPLVIYTDSQFARGAVRPGSTWNITKNPTLVALVRDVRAEAARWPFIDIRHVRGHADTPPQHRPGNHRVDYLAGLSVDMHKSTTGEPVKKRPVVELDAEGQIVPRSRGRSTPQRNSPSTQESDCQPVPYAEKLAQGGTPGQGSRPVPETVTETVPDGSEYVVVDVEVTHAGNDGNIVEIAAVIVSDGQVIAEFVELVNPGVAITQAATAMHGISDADIASARDTASVLVDFLVFLGKRPIVAYNATADRERLAFELDRVGLPRPGGHVYCALRAARAQFARQDIANHKLATIARVLGVTATSTHRSLGDVVVTAGVIATLRARRANWTLARVCGWQTGDVL